MNVKHFKPQQYSINVSFPTQKSIPQNTEITQILSMRPFTTDKNTKVNRTLTSLCVGP